ncbi:MAG: hypothetical protein M0Z58_07510, partial [Nitrospiraceae bacterium]|nr:hypothetical protein [Nitrospiraceae bacterium]
LSLLFTSLLLFLFLSGVAAAARQFTVMGTVKSVDLGAGILVVTSDTGGDVRVTAGKDMVERIRHYSTAPGDDVTVRYVRQGGVNVATFFRKIMGCGVP